jgi:sensor histidine kinase YesM
MENNEKLPYNYSFRKVLPLMLLTGIIISLSFIIAHRYLNFKDSAVYIAHGLLMTTGLWLGCMTIVKYLWYKYPWEKHPVKHILYEILLITCYTLIFSYTLYKIEKALAVKMSEANIPAEILLTLLITYFITAIHEAVFFYFQWKYNFSKSVRLEKANIEANYETLKAQVNPHFIFNSLNSLSSIVDDNPLALKYIQNLSGFLRYVLNSNEQELVPLQAELDTVISYVELQRTRFGNHLDLKLPSEVPSNAHIPPLTVQMLVDNCIKHNIISAEKPLFIKIESNDSFLSVENNLQPKLDVPKSGHGLKNITERYSYFTKEQPVITESDNSFCVRIPLLKISP